MNSITWALSLIFPVYLIREAVLFFFFKDIWKEEKLKNLSIYLIFFICLSTLSSCSDRAVSSKEDKNVITRIENYDGTYAIYTGRGYAFNMYLESSSRFYFIDTIGKFNIGDTVLTIRKSQ